MLNKAKKALARFTYPHRQNLARWGNKNERQIMLNHRDENGHGFQYDEHGHRIYFASALNDYRWADVAEPVTRQQLKQWVKDLRSGQFQQGNGYLCHDTFTDSKDEDLVTGQVYCCLGVLVNDKLLKDNDGSDHYDYNGESGLLNIYDHDGNREQTYHIPKVFQLKLAQMNDEHGKSFDEIADYLEKEFNLV